MLSADEPARRLVERLLAEVARCESALVAFSGGVDSTVVLAVAARALGARAVALTGHSASLAPEEAQEAESLARTLGVELLAVATGELDDPAYVANAPDRCFHCKRGLYEACRRVADERGLAAILNGTNADDPADWRPGLRAAGLAGVLSPLLACGLGKAQVRAVARHMGLPNWDKPALACLASRLPYGTAVSAERLAAVHAVETHLRAAGFRQVRARHFGPEARLEVEPERVGELLALARSARGGALLAAVRAAGFERFTVAEDGYRTGSLNPSHPAEIDA